METLNLPREVVGRRYPAHRNYLGNLWAKGFVGVIQPQDAAKFAGSDSCEIPTYFTPALRDGPFEIFADLGIELKRLLHVSQDYEYRRPLRSQKWVESQCEVSDLKEKSSKLGDIYIMDLRSEFSQDGEVCITSTMRVFVRRS